MQYLLQVKFVSVECKQILYPLIILLNYINFATDTVYDYHKSICCGRRIFYRNPDMSCCGSLPYHYLGQVCCRGKIYVSYYLTK